MMHPEILRIEKFGSRADNQGYRCTFCDRQISEEDVYIDLFGRSFCDKKCKEVYYGKY